MGQPKPAGAPRGAPRGGPREGPPGSRRTGERASGARPVGPVEARASRPTRPAGGSEDDAFRLLVEPLRAELHAHCRQILGSPDDAEDAVQDTLLRAWRGLPRFQGRSSLRSWLYRIATNACLDALAGRRRRATTGSHAAPGDPGAQLSDSSRPEPDLEEVRVPPDGSLTPEAGYERRESLELAVLTSLQHLPPRQRAALILREALDFSASETAAALETSVASANSALQRARKAVAARLPDQSQQAPLRALEDEHLRRLARKHLDAWEKGDLTRIVALLTQDGMLAVPADGDQRKEILDGAPAMRAGRGIGRDEGGSSAQ
jgi:RNA polymerase sigma-70 factor (ECF subfamily)